MSNQEKNPKNSDCTSGNYGRSNPLPLDLQKEIDLAKLPVTHS